MKIEMPKGTRDIPPEKKILRDKIVSTIKGIFESYGFLPLETPSFERYDVLASKYAGGEEILKEIFTFQDQGKRKLALRYDLTVPFARFIAMNPMIKMPFKRYAIGRVYRDGPIKRGRLREFYQCDADIVGTKSMVADATCLMVANEIFNKLGKKIILKVNNRKILNGLMRSSNVPDDKIETAILSIDKLEKMGEDYVRNELREKGIKDVDKIFDFLSVKDIDDLKLDDEEGKQGIEEIKELSKYVDFTFDITLARGLSYYTGTVFEGFLDEINVAACGGGRYDTMIGNLVSRDMPAVGISIGLEVLSEVIKPEKENIADIYIAPIGNVMVDALKVAEKLRKIGLKVDIDMNNRGISKNLAYANSYNIPYVLIVGDEEIKNEKYALKNMETGEQEVLTIEEIKSKIFK